jgi:hypothetical protein
MISVGRLVPGGHQKGPEVNSGARIPEYPRAAAMAPRTPAPQGVPARRHPPD